MRVRVLGLVVALTLPLAAVALAAPAVDQQQTSVDAGSENVLGGGSEQKLAQVVTAGVAGLLTEVRLPVRCGDPVSIVSLEIRDVSTATGRAEPGRTVLGSSTAGGSIFLLPLGTVEFRPIALGTPPFVPAESQFAFVVSATGSCGMRTATAGDPYPRGNGYFDARPNPPGVWVPLGLGSGKLDLAFQTVVEPACRVPELVGLTRSVAQTAIARHGCAVRRVTETFTSARRDTVIEQTPAPGTQLASGGTIDLVISLGQRPCIVPSVVGKALPRARAAIVAASCRVGRVTRVYSSRVARGRVVAQQPRPGLRRRAGARVHLAVSRGPR